MRRFNINVNGKAYDVAVEELGANVAPVVTTAPVIAPTPVQVVASTPVGTGEKVLSPMPGVIVGVKMSVGDSVTKGQAIIVLEAMKMENDVVSPCDGKITSIAVKKGDNVETNTVLATVG